MHMLCAFNVFLPLTLLFVLSSVALWVYSAAYCNTNLGTPERVHFFPLVPTSEERNTGSYTRPETCFTFQSVDIFLFSIACTLTILPLCSFWEFLLSHLLCLILRRHLSFTVRLCDLHLLLRTFPRLFCFKWRRAARTHLLGAFSSSQLLFHLTR